MGNSAYLRFRPRVTGLVAVAISPAIGLQLASSFAWLKELHIETGCGFAAIGELTAAYKEL
jgi:hypothetical protein